MTLNLWGYRGNWPARRARLLQVMQDEEIDVVLLQEVEEHIWQPNQGAEIAQLTGYAMVYVPSQRYFPWPSTATGLAILSRFPISNPLITEIFPQAGLLPTGANQRRVCERVELSIDGMSVVVYNTHFPLDEAGRRISAYRMWTQIVQEEAVLVIVGGDFNAKADETAILFLQGKVSFEGMHGELTDSWTQAGMGPSETYPIEAPRARIDYIFYQAEPSVIVQESRVIGYRPEELSDHAAVVTTFSIAPSRDPETPFVEEPIGSLEPTGGGGGSSFLDQFS